MDLKTKKHLAARVMGVGLARIRFDETRLAEIKEALTRQDILDLAKSKAITIKEITGRSVKEKRKTRRRAGKIKQKVNRRKKNYMFLTRKLRKELKRLKKAEKIDKAQYLKLRKQVKAKSFKHRAHLMEAFKK